MDWYIKKAKSPINPMNTNQTNVVARLACLVLSGLALAMFQGCSSHKPSGNITINQSDPPAEGPLALDIENHRGSVTVIVNPKLKEPVVTATSHGQRDSAVSQWTAASLANDAGRPVLRVLSAAPGADPAPIVDITVRVPDCAGARVHTDDGQIRLHGVRGAIDAQTSLASRGLNAIFITTQAPLKEPMLLHADRGAIEVRMGTGSAGRIQATSFGTVSVDSMMGDLRDVQVTRQAWTGTLNNGAADMRLKADDGNIVVSVGRTGS
jgi:hypothetical protein